MEDISVKRELVKITGDFIAGIILNEVIEIGQKFRKEFIDNNWHCSEYFEINFEKISEENMLGLSKISIRRCIKKLIDLGFVSVDRTEKRHKYKVEFEVINYELEKIGGKAIEKYKGKEFIGYRQTDVNDYIVHKKENSLTGKQEKNCIIYHNNNYSVIKGFCQDKKDFPKTFDKINKVINNIIEDKSEYIKINGENKPKSILNNYISQINEEDIIKITEKIMNTGHKINNYKAYVTATIYNYFTENKFIIHKQAVKNKFVNYTQPKINFKELRELEIRALKEYS